MVTIPQMQQADPLFQTYAAAIAFQATLSGLPNTMQATSLSISFTDGSIVALYTTLTSSDTIVLISGIKTLAASLIAEMQAKIGAI